MPKEAKTEAEKQLRRLEQMHPESAESAVVRTYLDWLVSLPWSHSTRDNLDILKAARVLNEDHYNLEKIKERILEFLAVRKLTKKLKGPVLCFVGPPGVGKHTTAFELAKALNCDSAGQDVGYVLYSARTPEERLAVHQMFEQAFEIVMER